MLPSLFKEIIDPTSYAQISVGKHPCEEEGDVVPTGEESDNESECVCSKCDHSSTFAP